MAGDELEATTSVVEDIKPKAKSKEEEEDEQNLGEETEETVESDEPEQLSFVLSDLSQAIQAKIVDKCGTRDYWENWANDIAKIAKAHVDRINGILVNSGTPEREAFDAFLEEIRDDLNPEISRVTRLRCLLNTSSPVQCSIHYFLVIDLRQKMLSQKQWKPFSGVYTTDILILRRIPLSDFMNQ